MVCGRGVHEAAAGGTTTATATRRSNNCPGNGTCYPDEANPGEGSQCPQTSRLCLIVVKEWVTGEEDIIQKSQLYLNHLQGLFVAFNAQHHQFFWTILITAQPKKVPLQVMGQAVGNANIIT